MTFNFQGDVWCVAYFTEVVYEAAPPRLRLSAFKDGGLRGAEEFDLEDREAEDVAEQLGLT